MELSLTIGNEDIAVEAFRGKIFGGTLEASGTMGIEHPSLNMVFSLAPAQLQSILKALVGYDGISGDIAASGSIAMTGYTVRQWVSSLQGTINLALRGVEAQGFDIDLLSRKIPTLPTIKEIRYWTHRILSSGSSKLDYASGPATINNGVLTLKGLKLNQRLLQGSTLDMQFDLPAWMVNLKANLRVAATESGPGGSVLPLTLSVSGDVDRPLVTWDKQGIEKYWEQKFFRH